MESFQNFLINLKIDGQEITPNMNKLAASSFYFPRFYQQVGQGNTSDAEFIVNTSFYVPPDGPATQMYALKSFQAYPSCCKHKVTIRQHSIRTKSTFGTVVSFIVLWDSIVIMIKLTSGKKTQYFMALLMKFCMKNRCRAGKNGSG